MALVVIGFFFFAGIVWAGEAYFYFSTNANRNRSLWALWNMAVPFLALMVFLILLSNMGGDFSRGFFPLVIFLFIPAAVFGVFLRIKNTKFCDQCGRKATGLADDMVSAEFCPRCGARLH